LVYQSEPLINDVVKRARLTKAAGVTIMHYCPGIEESPTPIDIAIKQGLQCALDAEQMELLDYLIMGKGHSISLVEKKCW